MTDLFKDFEQTSTATWQAKIETDLKGKPFDELRISLGDQKVNPCHRKEDVANINHEALAQYGKASWHIGEQFTIRDIAVSNKEILNALMNGVDAPVLYFEKNISDKEFEQLFENIGIEFIQTHFATKSEVDITMLESQWRNLVKKRGVENATAYFENHALDFRFFFDEKNPMEELKKCVAQFSKLEKTTQAHFILNIGKNYLQEIAKLRALKLLWIDFLKEKGQEISLPCLSVRFAASAYGEDKHDNLINASTLAMSAVVGGANHLVVRLTGESDSDKRHARNVQLILKHESGFDQVVDPAAGSYQIEKMTALLVQEVNK